MDFLEGLLKAFRGLLETHEKIYDMKLNLNNVENCSLSREDHF
jgi:hypothetical protein